MSHFIPFEKWVMTSRNRTRNETFFLTGQAHWSFGESLVNIIFALQIAISYVSGYIDCLVNLFYIKPMIDFCFFLTLFPPQSSDFKV